MQREEIIAEIIENLEKLGLIKPENKQPEPEQELTPEEEKAVYDAMTEEQEGFINYCVFVEGFNRALEEIPEGKHEKEAELIRERFNLKKDAPIYLMIMGYAAGVNHGFELGCKMYGTATPQEQKCKDL